MQEVDVPQCSLIADSSPAESKLENKLGCDEEFH
jgi:hypothetical protein